MTLISFSGTTPIIEGIIHKVSGVSVKAESSSVANPGWDPENAIDKGASVYGWHSQPTSVKGEFLKVKFPSNWILATNYSIQNPKQGTSHLPRSWSVEGFDGSKWHEISKVVESGLSTFSKIGTWPFTQHGPFNEFKITSTGYDYQSSSSFALCIGEIDFFGLLCENKEQCKVFSENLPNRISKQKSIPYFDMLSFIRVLPFLLYS